MSDQRSGALLVAAGLLAGAIVVAALGGFGRGSILGALLAAASTFPAGYALWKGTQKETQHQTAYALLLLLGGLAVGGLLLVLKIIDWLR